jgi:hypothetical protein
VQNSDDQVRATQIALSSYRQIARSRGKHEGFELRGAEHGYFMAVVAFRKQRECQCLKPSRSTPHFLCEQQPGPLPHALLHSYFGRICRDWEERGVALAGAREQAMQYRAGKGLSEARGMKHQQGGCFRRNAVYADHSAGKRRISICVETRQSTGRGNLMVNSFYLPAP